MWCSSDDFSFSLPSAVMTVSGFAYEMTLNVYSASAIPWAGESFYIAN
jgi:hypothetical protein